MGLLDRFKWWGENRSTKASATQQSMRIAYNAATFTNWEYSKLVATGYMRNVVVYRCVELGSQLFSQVPWKATNSRGTDVPDNHPLLDLLNRPNPFQSGVAFRHQARALLRLHGNLYIEKQRRIGRDTTTGTVSTSPRELYVIPPERMTIELDADGARSNYVYQWQGFIKKWPIDPITGVSDILHIRRFNPIDDLYGFGDLKPASRSTDTWNSVVEYNKCLLDNSGNPPGVFSIKQDKDSIITPQQLETARQMIDSFYTGVHNAGKPIVAPNIDYKAMAWSPKDMEWNKSKDSVAKDICIAFGVPYVLLNMTDSTFANAEEARLSYFEDQILPELELFRDEMNHWFMDDFPNIELKFNVDVLPFMSQKLAKKANAVENMSLILTINEARELFGFEKLKGFDYIKGAQAQPDATNFSDPNAVPPPDVGNNALPGLPNNLSPTKPAAPAKPKTAEVINISTKSSDTNEE